MYKLIKLLDNCNIIILSNSNSQILLKNLIIFIKIIKNLDKNYL